MVQPSVDSTFIDLCRMGSPLDKLKGFVADHGCIANSISTGELALTSWCKHRHHQEGDCLKGACWIYNTFGLSDPYRLHPAMDAALQNDYNDVVKWLFTIRAPLQKLYDLCKAGELSELQEFVNKHRLTTEVVRARDNYALRVSCEYGHLAVAQWLVERFGLTAEDARAHDNEALRENCAAGNLKAAQWLVETFGLTAEDARACGNWALRFSCSGGHLAVAQWLVNHFGLTEADARADDNAALRFSRFGNHLTVAQWLTERFDL